MISPDKHRLGVRAAIVRDNAILVVEFIDETGLHYNLPGGGVQAGESLYAALHREEREEVYAEIEIGQLLLTYEYYPPALDYFYGKQTGITFLFSATLRPGSEPRLPDHPDPNETAVKWIPLGEFPGITLYPRCQVLILQALKDEYPRPLFTTEI